MKERGRPRLWLDILAGFVFGMLFVGLSPALAVFGAPIAAWFVHQLRVARWERTRRPPESPTGAPMTDAGSSLKD